MEMPAIKMSTHKTRKRMRRSSSTRRIMMSGGNNATPAKKRISDLALTKFPETMADVEFAQSFVPIDGRRTP
jgi:hypothetical protein